MPSKRKYSGQGVRPAKPTKAELRTQVFHGLREAGFNWRERRLSPAAIQMLVRRATNVGFTIDDIERISGIPARELNGEEAY